MASVTLKQFDGSAVSPRDDAILYNMIIQESGIFKGCEITHLGSNQIKIKEGTGIIKGRKFDVQEQTISCALATSGSMKGRLYLHMDLSAIDTPIEIKSVAAAALPDLVQEEDCNYTNGVYEMELCTYDVSNLAISGLTVTYKTIEGVFPVLKTLDEIIANTKEGYIAGAMAVKELEARSGGCALSYNEDDDQFYIKGWGADAVWVPLGKMERTFLGNTSGGTIDCTGIKNYQKLTAENFSLVPINLYAANNPPSGTSSENAGMTVDKALADMSYNPDTGVLTVPSMTVSDTYSYGDYWDKSITAKVTVAVYCYHQGVYNSGGTKIVNGTAVRSGTTIIKADTGLASVKGIILCLDGDIPSKNITRGALYSDILSLIFQYGSTAKATYAVDGSTAMSIEDGVVTITTPSESYPYNTGTYNWIAWGE